MQLQFNSISETGKPGQVFLNHYNTYWPAYEHWLKSKKQYFTTDLDSSVSALKKYMPEMLPTYERICSLVNANSTAAKFLTGFQPPAYISACSQAVFTKNKIQLVRNYDDHPKSLEGTLLLSSWNGKKVIASSDCLIGVLDGMNEDGLVISLTFGGRNVVGEGFGIPFIMRYALEFCNNVKEATAVFTRIPCHMSYNVTLLDKSGAYTTIYLSPDRKPKVNNNSYTTNHQENIDWAENATFNKTIEREAFLKELINQEGLDVQSLNKAFLKEPLYASMFSKGFGTLYTAVYEPLAGTVQFLWPEDTMIQSFKNFVKQNKKIIYKDNSVVSGSQKLLEKDSIKYAPQKAYALEYLKRKNQHAYRVENNLESDA